MTRALILAAGRGDRLRPLTDEKPKCLVPLLGVSLLERQAATLRECGVEEIHVTTGYRADQIGALGFETSHNSAFACTNMVESLFCARDFVDRPGDLVIAYGDIIYSRGNLERLLANDDEIALMIDSEWRRLWELRFDNPLDDAETLVIDESGYVAELGKKPKSYERIRGQYTGLIKIRGDKTSNFISFYESLDRDAAYDGQPFANMYMTSFLQLLIHAGWHVKAVEVRSGWLEVDSIADLALYEEMARKGELGSWCK